MTVFTSHCHMVLLLGTTPPSQLTNPGGQGSLRHQKEKSCRACLPGTLRPELEVLSTFNHINSHSHHPKVLTTPGALEQTGFDIYLLTLSRRVLCPLSLLSENNVPRGWAFFSFQHSKKKTFDFNSFLPTEGSHLSLSF